MTQHTRPDIVDVLTRHGANVRARSGWAAIKCPYHGDTTASASVNTTIGRFNCHGCGVRGDVYDLIQHYESCDYPAALALGDNYQPSSVVSDSKQSTFKPEGRRGRR
jgi:DNA primase